jgi:ATP-dependent protease ClpP protease subunit
MFVGQPMPPDLAAELFAAAKREGVPPAQWLRAALDTFRERPGLAAAVAPARRSSPPRRSVAAEVAAARLATRDFCDDCDREIGGPPESRCKCHDRPPAPKIPPAPTVGYAWEARNLTPSAMKTDPIWPTRYAMARDHVARYGAGLAFLGPLAGGGLTDTTAEHFGRVLDAAQAAGARSLIVDVNSTGGDVREGLAMIAMLEKFSKEVGPTIANVSVRAHSMAAVIVTACDYAVASSSASLHVHGVSGGTDQERASLTDRLASILVARTLVPANEMRGWVTTEIALDAYAAQANGLVNEVAGGERAHELARRCTGRGRLVAFVSDPVAWSSWRRCVLHDRAVAAAGVTRF